MAIKEAAYLPPKKLKLPKNLGACADMLFDTKAERLRVQKMLALWEEQESELKDHIINNLEKSKDGGAVGQRYKAIIVRDQVPRIGDDKKFYQYVKKHSRFDFLQRRLNDKAVKETLEEMTPAQRKKGIPGIEMFGIVKVSLTKK